MTGIAVAAVSYDVPGAAAASGLGETTLRTAIAKDELVVHYYGTKPVIRAVDLDDWIRSLPTEKPRKSA